MDQAHLAYLQRLADEKVRWIGRWGEIAGVLSFGNSKNPVLTAQLVSRHFGHLFRADADVQEGLVRVVEAVIRGNPEIGGIASEIYPLLDSFQSEMAHRVGGDQLTRVG